MAVLEIARMRCLPDKGDALAAGLGAGARVIAASPGCLEVQVHRGVENPDQFVLLARWESVEAHQGYLKSASSPSFRAYINDSRDPETVEAAHFTVVADSAAWTVPGE
jgi:quinol monooxygenase YgiN